MVRDGDTYIPLDQRAAAANSARPAIYVNIHSTGQGTGVRMYSAMLPSAEENKGPFIDWNTAQASVTGSEPAVRKRGRRRTSKTKDSQREF